MAGVLIDNGTPVDLLSEFGGGPLNFVENHAYPGAVALLIRKGVDVNATEGSGRRALHWVVLAGHRCERIAQTLLEEGGDITAEIAKGVLPFIVPCMVDTVMRPSPNCFLIKALISLRKDSPA